MTSLRCFESFSKSLQKSGSVKRLLFTGASGRLGFQLLPYFRQVYGAENILLTDIKNDKNLPASHFKTLDVTNRDAFIQAVQEWKADTVIHLASLNAAKSEKDPSHSLEVNTLGTKNALEISKDHKLRLLYASSLDAFGPDTPRRNAPSMTVQRPTLISGVAQAYMEVLGEYYAYKYNTDYRGLRIPPIVSSVTTVNGIGAFVSEIYQHAVKNGKFTSYFKENQYVPMIYLEDLAAGAIQYLEAQNSSLVYRNYNVQSVSATPKKMAAAIQKHIPGFKIDYKVDERQLMVENWPQSIDDFDARNHWGYDPQYDLASMTEDVIKKLRK